LFKNLVWTSLTASTNDLVRNYCDFTLLIADKQTQGRGRQGKPWISEHKSLLFSAKIPLNLFKFSVTFIPILVAGALHSSLCLTRHLSWRLSGRKLAPDDVLLIKWPNDLLNDKKQKLAGILLEVVDESVIIGIGLNLEQPLNEDFAFYKSIFNSVWILQNFQSALTNFIKSTDAEIIEYFLRHSAAPIGEEVFIQQALSKAELAKVVGLNKDGALLVAYQVDEFKKTSQIFDAASLRLKTAKYTD
jgi:biotin-[acetyl-CoA-carboxylase] ligase BirA-like protein